MKNLRLAIRSLLHFRLYTVINILGLALALTCVIVIAHYVHGEFSVDRFSKNIDRLYVVTSESATEVRQLRLDGIRDDYISSRASPQATLGKHAGVEMRSDFILAENQEVVVERKNFDANVLVTDNRFFEMLDYPLLSGTPELDQPDRAVVTYEFAQKVFGKENPVGQTLSYNDMPSFTITGVLAPISTKTTIRFDVALSKSTSISMVESTLILLYPQQDYKEVNRQNNHFFRDTYYANGDSIRNQLYPLKKVYFSPADDIQSFYFTVGKKDYTVVLLMVGLLILAAGLINYINIQTAVFLRRGREFGMKKVFGASGGSMFLQLWVENMILIGLSLVLALSLTELLSPVVRNLLGFSQLPFSGFDLSFSCALFLALPLIVSLFPLTHYKRSTPIDSLRSIGKTGGRSRSRYIVLGIQYVITFVMISLSLLFLKQLNTMLHAELGFRTEDIIQVQLQRYRSTNQDDMERWREWWEDSARKQGVIVSRMNETPLFSGWAYGYSPLKRESYVKKFMVADETPEADYLQASHAWLDLYETRITEGDLFKEGVEDQIILTEQARKEWGISDFRETFVLTEGGHYLRDGKITTDTIRMQITGIAQNIRAGHPTEKRPPMVIRSSRMSSFFEPISAAIVPGKRQEAIEFLRQLHQEWGEGEFTYSFVEDDLEAMYAEDRKVATIYSIFTVIAILISALGLFSMSLFDVQQRYKEIAIRKVNGATTSVIIGLLLKKYIVLLGISFVIAVPIAWYAIQRYLGGFAYKTAVSWWIFAAALLITAGISLLTLIHQTRKAALANPADVIRNE